MNLLSEGNSFLPLKLTLVSMALVFFMFSATTANSWPWQTCDSKWEKAWERCGACTDLPARLRPSCDPDDRVLKNYPKGREDPRFKKAQADRAAEIREQRRREMDHIRIEGGSYNVNWGTTLAMSLNLYNGHPDKTLRTATFLCRVEINNSIELFNGYAYASPSLLPRRSSSVDLEFQGRQKMAIGLYSLPHEEQYERVPTISTRNHSVNSLQYSCRPVNAFFF